jgi:hypothetical protein
MSVRQCMTVCEKNLEFGIRVILEKGLIEESRHL